MSTTRPNPYVVVTASIYNWAADGLHPADIYDDGADWDQFFTTDVSRICTKEEAQNHRYGSLSCSEYLRRNGIKPRRDDGTPMSVTEWARLARAKQDAADLETGRIIAERETDRNGKPEAQASGGWIPCGYPGCAPDHCDDCDGRG